MDGNGRITMLDAVLALRIAAGLHDPTWEEYCRADVRPYPYDDRVTVLDAVGIDRWAHGLDRPPIGAVLKTSFATPETGDAVVNITMRSGYMVRGHIWPATMYPPDEIFLEGSGKRYGPSGRDGTGYYHINVPGGMYKLKAVRSEETLVDAGVSVSTAQEFVSERPLVVRGDRYDCDVTIPTVPPRPLVTVNLAGALNSLWMPRAFYLHGRDGSEVMRDMMSDSSPFRLVVPAETVVVQQCFCKLDFRLAC